MLERLTSAAAARPSGAVASASLGPVRDYIRHNPSELVTIADLTDLSGLTESHLIRAFHREFGLPYREPEYRRWCFDSAALRVRTLEDRQSRHATRLSGVGRYYSPWSPPSYPTFRRGRTGGEIGGPSPHSPYARLSGSPLTLARVTRTSSTKSAARALRLRATNRVKAAAWRIAVACLRVCFRRGPFRRTGVNRSCSGCVSGVGIYRPESLQNAGRALPRPPLWILPRQEAG